MPLSHLPAHAHSPWRCLASQVRTYVCGILYAVLQRPAVHTEAVQRDLAGLLRAVAANCGSELSASQINYVVEQVCTGEGLPCGQCMQPPRQTGQANGKLELQSWHSRWRWRV